ncbi:MAG TPA: efflux RND transporter periplasmic adaptor subunit [Candidatus Didemnitutus sp.]|nr:efflux RND transporter periplasmic adaptor subunit [Candidatus Didemnitutus sp.]
MTMPSSAPSPFVAETPTAPRRKKSKKTLFIVIGVVIVLVGLVLAAKAKSAGSEKPISVSFEKAVTKNITHLVTATGKVQPEIEVKISPEVAGEIIALPFKEGALVKKGDVICKIKPDYYQAQVDQQKAALVGAKAIAVQNNAQLLKAQEDDKRSEDLYAKKLISDSDYTVAKTALDVARANYDNAKAQIQSTEGFLSQAEDFLSKTTIYAPMDGTISALESEVGERVVGTGQFAGTEVMRIADLSNMEVRVKVNENDIVNVKLGDHAIVTVDAMPGRKFDGTVREISSSALTTGATGSGSASLAASASDEVTNFLVKIRITDKEGALRPGMSATVDVETETVKNVVAVPVQSVTVRAAGGKTTEELQQQKAKEAKERSGNDLEVASERDDARRNRDQLQRVVFVHDGTKVRMVKVVTGIADNSQIEIKSGVKAGEEVVSGSYAAISRLLKDGSKVMAEVPTAGDKK